MSWTQHQLDVWEKGRDDLKNRRSEFPKPHNFIKPTYGTPQYWRCYADGWIDDSEAQTDQALFEARSKRAKAARFGLPAPYPKRWDEKEPKQTRQYANPMSTEYARDKRLVPQAKALLAVIRARCGKGTQTQTTKFTLADMMGRSTRSIQRYIKDLKKFGYIDVKTRTDRRGWYTGLVIKLTQKVLPYWSDFEQLAADLAEKVGYTWHQQRLFDEDLQEETKTPSKNLFKNISLYKQLKNGSSAPPI